MIPLTAKLAAIITPSPLQQPRLHPGDVVLTGGDTPTVTIVPEASEGEVIELKPGMIALRLTDYNPYGLVAVVLAAPKEFAQKHYNRHTRRWDVHSLRTLQIPDESSAEQAAPILKTIEQLRSKQAQAQEKMLQLRTAIAQKFTRCPRVENPPETK